MSNDYRIWIRDLGNPESRDKRTKAHGSQADMANRANYPNKMMARRHGDGRYHAYIAPDNQGTNNPMIKRTATFRCYDGIGRVIDGWYTEEEEARQLCAANEEWTYSEVL